MKKIIIIAFIFIVFILLFGIIAVIVSPELRFMITGKIDNDLCQYYYSSENDFNKCVSGLAGRKQNPKLCQQLNSSASNDDKDGCYSYAYSSMGRVDLCYSLSSQIGGCIYTIATNTRNKDLCDQAALYYPADSSDFFKKSCRKEIECKESSNNNQVEYVACLNKN